MLVIDGTYLIYKSFYRTSKFNSDISEENHARFLKASRNTFLKIIANLKNKYNPSDMLIFFDCEGNNFRHNILPSYKSHRKEKPKELFEIKKEIYSFLKQHNFAFQVSEGVEADDLIASYVAKNPNEKISIFTGDSDLGALVSKNVTLLLEKTKKIQVITSSNFCHFFQVPPSRIAEFKALQGDKSDAVKGIVGLFRNETIHLLMEFPSLEYFFEHGQNHYLYEKLNSNKEKILTNLAVTKMVYNCPLEFDKSLCNIERITLPSVISEKIKW